MLIVLLVAVSYFNNRSTWLPRNPAHSFVLPNKPPFLSEELALAKAREALSRDGYDVAAWLPFRDGRTSSPDGRTDEFMSRNTVRPNRGVIMFTNILAAPPRLVSVELDGSRVICQTSTAK